MAKRASKSKTPKPSASSVPCLRVVVGGRPGSTGKTDPKSCAIVGESRGAATKFDLGKKYGSTSKTVATPKKNKPCLGTRKRKGCPVQLAFDKGQPFLRFCTTEKKAGFRIDVESPADAVAKANAACGVWAATGKFDFPPETPLRGPVGSNDRARDRGKFKRSENHAPRVHFGRSQRRTARRAPRRAGRLLP